VVPLLRAEGCEDVLTFFLLLRFFFGGKEGMIACVGIVAKENNPLLLRVFPQTDDGDTKFHHICYCSIDVFEEREQAMRSVPGCAMCSCCSSVSGDVARENSGGIPISGRDMAWRCSQRTFIRCRAPRCAWCGSGNYQHGPLLHALTGGRTHFGLPVFQSDVGGRRSADRYLSGCALSGPRLHGIWVRD